jgi:hypothetical protein
MGHGANDIFEGNCRLEVEPGSFNWNGYYVAEMIFPQSIIGCLVSRVEFGCLSQKLQMKENNLVACQGSEGI